MLEPPRWITVFQALGKIFSAELVCLHSRLPSPFLAAGMSLTPQHASCSAMPESGKQVVLMLSSRAHAYRGKQSKKPNRPTSEPSLGHLLAR